MIILTIILVGFFYVLSITLKRWHQMKILGKTFPTPPTKPFFGILLNFPSDPAGIFKVLTSFFENYGKNILVWAPYYDVGIWLSDPKDVETVLANPNSKTAKKSIDYDNLVPWLGTGLLISWGEKWFQRRKVITPSFHFSILEDFIDVFNRQSDVFVKKLTKLASTGDFDIYTDVTHFTLDVICGYKFSGGSKVPVMNIEEGYQVLIKGNKSRHVRPTKMNSNSSRSHAIFTIHVLSKTETNQTSASLHLVDLAGSEGVRRTGHEGIARAEGVNINQGLLSIGKVLQALSIGGKVIPYRDSVLSLVLQDSLNTNSYLTLLACVSPHKEDLSETLSTLRFAQSAKSLKNTPQINSILLEIKKNKETKGKTPQKDPLRLKNQQNDVANTPPNNSRGSAKKKPPSATKRAAPPYSNTFCTPSKIKRIEGKKLNQSEMVLTQKEKSKQTIKDIKENLMTLDFLNIKKRSNDLNLNKGHDDSINSRTSLFNVSSSTAIDAPVTNSYSPILRHITNMENHMKEVLDKIQVINPNGKTLRSSLEKFASTAENERNTNDTQKPVGWNSIKKELQEIVRNEISSFTAKRPKADISAEKPANIDNAKCKLFLDSPNFKIPLPPLEKSDKSENSLANLTNDISGNNISQDGDQTVFHKPRRSARLSILKSRNSIISKETSPKVRRSVRLSLASKPSPRRSSPGESERLKSTRGRKPGRSRTKPPTKNEVIASYFDMTTITESFEEPKKNLESAKSKHQKAILDMFNTSSMKELQILPRVGLKTAYQIVTYRTLHGRFKNFKAVSKMPLWRGKQWNIFKEANNISDE